MPRRPPKKPGGKEADEVDTATNISREPTITSENTTRVITNLSKNEKMPNIGSMIKEHEVNGVWLLKDNKPQVTTPSKQEDDTQTPQLPPQQQLLPQSVNRAGTNILQKD